MENKNKWVCIEIPFKVSEDRVWSVLTEPHLTERYMYNCQLHSTWEIGSSAVWKERKTDGTYKDHVRAKVLEYSPKHKLCFLIAHEDKGFGACESELKFTILKQDSGVVLKIEQGDFSEIPNGVQSYTDCLMGWTYVKKDLITTVNECT